jgi:hypothetical protein
LLFLFVRTRRAGCYPPFTADTHSGLLLCTQYNTPALQSQNIPTKLRHTDWQGHHPQHFPCPSNAVTLVL